MTTEEAERADEVMSDGEHPGLSIIVPVYRGHETVRELHRQLAESLDEAKRRGI